MTPDPPAVVPIRVNVSAVNLLESTSETVVVYGTLVPDQKARLSFEVGGRVQKVRRTVEEAVAEGDVIAYLESGALSKQRQQLMTSIENSRQRLRSASREAAPTIQEQISVLEGQVRSVDAELKRRIIVAPFSGFVLDIKVAAGDLVGPSTPVAEIVTDGPPQIVTDLTNEMASRVLAQQNVWGGIGERAIELNVKSSSERRGQSPARKVVFDIKETLNSDSWSYGDVVELRFREAVSASGCWLPVNALQRGSDNNWFVLLVVSNAAPNGKQSFRVEECKVDVLHYQDHKAYVESTLTTGDFVVVDGTHRIVIGQEVTPVANAGQSIRTIKQGGAN